MKILLQIALLFGVYWVSVGIERILPFTFPASVIGLLLLLVLLLLRVVKLKHLQEKADFVLGNLSFFFIPASAGIMNYWDVIRDNAAAFLIICVVSTVLTFAVTVWTVQLVCRLLARRREAAE